MSMVSFCDKCGKQFTSRTGNKLCRNCRPKTNSPVELECNHCHKKFFGNPDTLYCSSCDTRWSRSKASKINCDTCGNEFASLYGELTCRSCRHKKRLENNKKSKTCSLCGCGFYAKHAGEFLCDSCKKLSGRIECTCVVCGKKFTPVKKTKCKTCSRKCQGLYVQNSGKGIKYNDAELKDRIIKYLKEKGTPTSLEELGSALGGITHKVFSARGWKLTDLITEAGILDPKLPKNTSIFERSVYDVLKRVLPENTPIQLQKTFDGCVGVKNVKLRFDFFLPTYNLLIEADGSQHYSTQNDSYFTHNKELRLNDIIKNKFCYDNNIALLRIQYTRYKTQISNIEQVLKGVLPPNGEISKVNCFNCWNGSELIPIPISSQAL